MGDNATRRTLGGARVPLSQLECDVLTISARGRSADEVARELGMTTADVRVALASACDKLRARSKLEAVVIALRQRDIQP
jgi:DNA-binding CsgD family transcriptional regulator